MARSAKWYGWVPDLPDHRDRKFRAPLARIGPLPPRVDLRDLCPPIWDQGALGSCTAQAIAARDGESLRRAAHGLKGAAANFDADAVVAAARTLEEIGRTGEFGEHEAAWQALTLETQQLINILRAVSA